MPADSPGLAVRNGTPLVLNGIGDDFWEGSDSNEKVRLGHRDVV